jgi:hypothetical protein
MTDPTTVPIVGKGSQLQVAISDVLTTVAKVLNIDAPSPEPQMYDATALDTEGAGRPQEPTGYADCGKVSGTVLFNPQNATHKYLLTLLATPQVVAWNLIFADEAATEWPFDGTLTKLAPKVVMEDAVKADFEITLHGLPVYPS